jgi:hypothetical protein
MRLNRAWSRRAMAAGLTGMLAGSPVASPRSLAQDLPQHEDTRLTGAAAFALVIGNTLENKNRVIYFVPDGTAKARYIPAGDDVRTGAWNFVGGMLCLTATQQSGMEVTSCLAITVEGTTATISLAEDRPGEEFTIVPGNARHL